MEKKRSFEEALNQLETIVKELETGDLSLEASVSKYNEGILLAKFCHEQLKSAQDIIVKMMKDDKLEDFIEPEE
ncbi:MAG: exodeoxyribonuclease VII small subunit [Firmicutes bacterium]|nr:exodeoxyribonuclease VII small subunit [Bacillota bacterium]